MMKNLLLTLFTALMVSVSFSQLSVTLVTPGPLAGTTVHGPNNVTCTVDIQNTGTTAIPAGDTIFYWISLGTSTTPISFTGRGGSWSIDILSAPLAAGAKLTKSAQTGDFTTPPTSPTITDVCLRAAIGVVAARNTTSGASSCYKINRLLASVDENKLEANTKVFVAAGILNMASTSNDNLIYSVVSITGQVISQGNFVNNKQVDLTGVAKGIYAIIITNGTEKVTKKVAIQ